MIEILQYKTVNKNSLQGILSIEIQKWGNFIINEISYFKKDDQRWISFPSKPYEKDGEKKYFPLNRFKESSMAKSFQEKVLEALDKYLEINKPSQDFEQEKIPF